MGFIDDSQLSTVAANTYSATLDPGWQSLVDIHGGYVSAIVARAIELTLDDSERVLRSFNAQFLRPAHAGPVAITVETVRTGRAVSFLQATVLQDERPVLTASAVAGVSREGLSFMEVPPPAAVQAGIPAGAERFGDEPGRHLAQLDVRLEPGLAMLGGNERARVAGWIGPLDPTETITLPWLICATDFMPPSMLFRSDRRVMAASVDMAVQLVCSNPGEVVGPGGSIFVEMICSISAEGFSVEDGTFWAATGQLLATARQVRLSGA